MFQCTMNYSLTNDDTTESEQDLANAWAIGAIPRNVLTCPQKRHSKEVSNKGLPCGTITRSAADVPMPSG